MSIHTDNIVALVGRRPGLRTVEISDGLDIDPEVVERELAQLSEDRRIVGERVTAPNGHETLAWRVANGIGWKSPNNINAGTATPAVKPEPSDDPLLTVKQVVIPVFSTAGKKATGPSSAPGTSKHWGIHVETAIKHLQQNGPVSNDAMRRALGVTYYPQAALKTAMQSGVLTYENNLWHLRDSTACAPAPVSVAARRKAVIASPGVDVDAAHPLIPPAPAVEALMQTGALQKSTIASSGPTQHDAVHTPNHYTAGGMEVIDILRAKLTPEEFRGFLKGNIVKYTLRAELKGGAQDYQKASVYAGWLVKATA